MWSFDADVLSRFGNESCNGLDVLDAFERHVVLAVGSEKAEILLAVCAEDSDLRKRNLTEGAWPSRAAPAKDTVAQPALTDDRMKPLVCK